MRKLFEWKTLFSRFSIAKQKFMIFNDLLYKKTWCYLSNLKRYSRLFKKIFGAWDKLTHTNHKGINTDYIFQRKFDKNKERLKKMQNNYNFTSLTYIKCNHQIKLKEKKIYNFLYA